MDADNYTHALSQIYQSLSKGEQAELRRGQPSAPFWRMLTHIGKADASTEKLRKWRLLIQLITIADYDSTPFGFALQEADYSEARLKRLLEAGDDQLPGLLRRTAKQLQSAGQGANWNTARRLLFGYDREDVRLQIAKEYYTYSTTSSSNEDDSSHE